MEPTQRNTTERNVKKRAETGITIKGAIILAAIFCGGLLAGRVKINEGIWPFGPAYILAAFMNSESVNPYVALAGVMGALCTNLGAMENIPFNFAVVTIVSISMTMALFMKVKRKYMAAALCTLAAYVIATIAFKRSMLLGVMSSAIEMCVCLVMGYMMHVVMKLLFSRKRTVLADAEIISIGFCAVLIVMGIGDIAVGRIYLRNIAAGYFGILASYLGGPAVGCAVSAAAGAASVLGGADTVFLLTLTVCSLVAGIFNKINRYLFAAGYVLIFAACEYYMGGTLIEYFSVISIALGAAGFAATPKKALDYMGKYVNINLLRMSEARLSGERFSQLTVGRLKEVSAVFKNASKVFSDMSKRRQQGISYAIAAIPENACANCVFYSSCWDKDFERTYLLMQKLYAKYAKHERIYERDLGQTFLKQCLHSDKLIAAARDTFKEYELNSKWERKVEESRGVLKDQFLGLASVIDELSKEVQTDFEIRADVEDEVKRTLDEEGLSAKEVCAQVTASGLSVSLAMKSAEPYESLDQRVRAAVSRACGMRMSRQKEYERQKQGYYIFTYGQAKAIGLNTGIAVAAKEGAAVTGDAYSVRGLRDGRYMLLISDGMGSGEKAAKESAAVVSLLEDFYGAGFEDNVIINSVNKLMVLGGSEEMFSTVDMCMVDLKKSVARFTKIGAPHSYLIRADSVKKIASGALPVGILEEIKPVVHDIELSVGDIILMFSDGVSDAEIDSDDVYRSIIRAAERRNVQEIAQTVLSLAVAARGGKKDDMTVIASRVVRG